MGKKFSQDSVKISKRSSSDKKNNLNYSLIKVLRPKVYITDSSTFKTLVQELTGNGNGNGNGSPSPISIPSPRPNYFSNPIKSTVAIDYGFQESSPRPELSFDSSEATNLSSSNINIPTQQLNMPTPLLSSSSDDDDELQSYNWFGKFDDNMMSFPHEYINGDQIDQSSASCFLGMDVDVDPFLYNDDTAYAIPIMPHEVCVYDYDLSGIIL